MIRKEYLPFGKPNFSAEEIEAVACVMRSGWVGMGPETIAFEQELSDYVGAPHVVTVNSCTSALFLSLLVLGVGPGDEVICPSLTWCSTANAALYLGAKPIFCDVDPETLCLTPEHVLAKVTSRTKAVMVVHFGGLAVDVEELRATLPRGISVIEDAAHALAARFSNGKPVGSSGNLTCFSFYGNKNLSTGEGGAIALFEDSLAERLQSLRQHGLPSDAWKRFSHPRALLTGELCELGYKMNYTDLQASIGRIQLKRQAEFNNTRFTVASHYYERLRAITPSLCFQSGILNPNHARHLFEVILPVENMKLTRDDLLLALRSHNIGASIHYRPLHTMPLYCQKFPQQLPNTDWLYNRIMTLPTSASMNLDDADYVVAKLIELIIK
jgi:dTDP-4-amino-4,6-dideoxygalactose transaminase